MEEDIVLKIKEKEILEVIKIIFIVFGCFLFILGATFKYEETVIQVTLMWVFALIVGVLNYGELIVSEKGVKSKPTGYIKYNEIYRLELKNRTLLIYTRKDKKPYVVYFAKNEDYVQIEKIHRYIDSKIKRVEEDIKDHIDFMEKI